MPVNTNMEVLGVKIDNFSWQEVLGKVNAFLIEDKFHQIVTVNPEFILAAQKDKEFRNILNGCDLNVADGMGIRFAFFQSGKKLKARIAGINLMEEILKIADEKKYRIFLAAKHGGLSSWEETAGAIRNTYPKLEISGVNVEANAIGEISNRNPEYSGQILNFDIVFCNFGAPDQEKLLHSLKQLSDSKIRLGMGVGGSFDYLSGKVKRAPASMQKIGLEWIWRLIQQPRRWKRICNAVIIFPVKILFSR